MTKLNTIDQIKKAEKEATEIKEKAVRENQIKFEETKKSGEDKLKSLNEEMKPEIREIMAASDQEIKKIKDSLSQKTDLEQRKINQIPTEKKKKAVQSILNKLVSG